MRAIADEKIAVNFDSGVAQGSNFFKKRDWVKHNAISDYTAASLAQHSAGNELQDKSFAVDDDRVPGIVAARIARHHRELLREHVNNLAFALAAPLGADYDGGLTFLQRKLLIGSRLDDSHKSTAFAHTQRRRTTYRQKSGIQQGRGVLEIITRWSEEGQLDLLI